MCVRSQEIWDPDLSVPPPTWSHCLFCRVPEQPSWMTLHSQEGVEPIYVWSSRGSGSSGATPHDLHQHFLQLSGKVMFVSLWDKRQLGKVPHELVFRGRKRWRTTESQGVVEPPAPRAQCTPIPKWFAGVLTRRSISQKCGQQAMALVL